jgi:hypothetical protein
MFDVAHRAVVQADQGSDIRFFGVFASGGDQGAALANNWVEPAPGFRGPLSIFAPTVQPPFMHHPLGDRRDQVQVFGEVSLATGKPATSGPDPAACRTPESAVDRDPHTLWQGPAGSWLQVDLGGVRTIGRFGFASAWARFGKDSYVRQCELQVSEDGASFTTADTLGTYGCAWADMALKQPVRARFARLVIKTVGSLDDQARISEFRVFEKDR